jgi:hypothetical protein
MLTNAHLDTLLRLDKSSPQFPNQLLDALGRDFDENVPSLQNDDLAGVVEYLDKVPPLC